MTLGMAFRELREHAGITMRVAAEGIGCSHVHICNIENGYTIPSLEIIGRARLFYGLDPYILAAGRSELERHLQWVKQN